MVSDVWTPLCEDLAKYSLNPKEEMTVVWIRIRVLSLSCCRNHWWLFIWGISSSETWWCNVRLWVQEKLEKEAWLSAWKHVCVCVLQTRLKAHRCVNKGRLISVCACGRRTLLHWVIIYIWRNNGLLALNFMTYFRFEISWVASYVCLCVVVA